MVQLNYKVSNWNLFPRQTERIFFSSGKGYPVVCWLLGGVSPKKLIWGLRHSYGNIVGLMGGPLCFYSWMCLV